MNRKSLASLLAGCALVGACYDLDVVAIQPTSGTTYTRAEIEANPVLIERLVAGVFVNYWAGQTSEAPWTVLSIFGEEMTSSANSFNAPVWDLVQEPRPAYNNNLEEGIGTNKTPWSLFYEANAAAVDFPPIIRERNIRILDPETRVDNTRRLLAFARWVSGLAHTQLALLFDSAAIIGEGVDYIENGRPKVLPLAPYTEVRDSAISFLKDAAQQGYDYQFVFPLNEGQYVYNTGYDHIMMRQAAHSHIARLYAYTARTPAERAAAKWDSVKYHAERGITSPFGPMGQPTSGGVSYQHRRTTTAAPQNTTAICNGWCSAAGYFRVDTRLIGPSDTSGAYQGWLAKVREDRFDTVTPPIMYTPDARIQEPFTTTPVFKPTYFKFTDIYPPQNIMDTTIKGAYYVSYYWNSTRALDNRTQNPAQGGGRNLAQSNALGAIQDDMMKPVEMDLLIAEAEWRMGNFPAAAALVNISRTGNGELPPVTAAGVPISDHCVPRRWDGSCGDLFDAIVYEKRIETYGTGIAFFDARGWGCLLAGTMTHFPVPATQLDLMGKPNYTYGGVERAGTPGTAAAPTNCPLMFKP